MINYYLLFVFNYFPLRCLGQLKNLYLIYYHINSYSEFVYFKVTSINYMKEDKKKEP
jgi:hypothetical protein